MREHEPPSAPKRRVALVEPVPADRRQRAREHDDAEEPQDHGALLRVDGPHQIPQVGLGEGPRGRGRRVVARAAVLGQRADARRRVRRRPLRVLRARARVPRAAVPADAGVHQELAAKHPELAPDAVARVLHGGVVRRAGAVDGPHVVPGAVHGRVGDRARRRRPARVPGGHGERHVARERCVREAPPPVARRRGARKPQRLRRGDRRRVVAGAVQRAQGDDERSVG